MSKPTIREVAQRARVSVATVSNALNRPEMVAEATLERVQRAIEEIGFIRNSAARQLRGARSPVIGLVVLYLDNPFFMEVARGVEDAAREVDHLVVLCSSAGDQRRENDHLRLLDEQRAAGVLLTPAGRRRSKLSQELHLGGMPIVLLDRRSKRKDQSSVAVDDVEGARLAARHLVGLGHRRIALINGPRSITQCADRRAGFVDELERHGAKLVARRELEMPEMTLEQGQRAAERLLSSRTPPTAVFCTNDLLALGAEHAFLAAEREVPGDIAIVGYDDVPFAAMAYVPLTTIRQPAYDIGYRAGQLVLAEAAGNGRPEHALFTPELVVRASTSEPAVRQ